jgi:hypothetical protein
MERNTKVRILQAIRDRKLTPAAIDISLGTYRLTDRPGLYRNESGFELHYVEIAKLTESGCFTITSMFDNDDSLPQYFTISDFIEGFTNHAEIRFIEPCQI